jgi:signal transduction histidine kinase
MFLKKGISRKTVIAIFCIFLWAFPSETFAGSADPEKNADPVSRLSNKWTETETILSSFFNAPAGEPKDPVYRALDDFAAVHEEFMQSPLYNSYRVSSFSMKDDAESIGAYLGELSDALAHDRKERTFALVLSIHQEIAHLQQLDAGLADTIHLSYFYLFYILTGVLALIVLVLWRLSRALELSQGREKMRADFSRLMVLAQEKERGRIARDLHDTVAQDLRGLGLKITRIGRGGEKPAELCREAADDQVKILDRVRDICTYLIPPDFHNAGLPDSLRQLCSEFGKRTGIECHITIQENLRLEGLDEEMQLQCFRLVQESLSNIEKHASANEAVVVLRNGEGSKPSAKLSKPAGKTSLLICVSDDGIGFEKAPSRENLNNPGFGNHLGIRGMFERINILGGSLDFISEINEGTMVQIAVPLG